MNALAEALPEQRESALSSLAAMACGVKQNKSDDIDEPTGSLQQNEDAGRGERWAALRRHIAQSMEAQG